jgi:UDP-N-acetylmuramoyl-tripeptide--D-alanyl-D-alanine ligase
MQLTALQAAEATNGKTTGEWLATDICFDSRIAKRGDLFFALIGEAGADGHAYVAKALEAGAVAAVVHQLVPGVSADQLLMVADTQKALEDIGRYQRRQFKGKVIAVTGSAGKTSVKEGLRQVLEHFGKTYASAKNFNNHIGTPMSLAKIDHSARFAVLEVGMSHAGEIRALVEQVRPHVATVNSIFPMHMGNFKDLSGIAYAKAEVYEHFVDGQGVAVLNADAPHADILRAQAQKFGAKEVLGFGKNAEAKLLSAVNHADGQTVQANVCGTEVEFEIQQQGEAHAYNALNILTMCYALGLDVVQAAGHLAELSALEGRGKTYTLPLPQGGEFTLIDDSYTGQPDAMIIALNGLAQWPMKPGGRRIALLGQMAELGEFSVPQHKRVGQTIAALPIDVVWGIGERIKDTLGELPARVEQRYFENKDGMAERLLDELLQPNDVLLVKGAHYSSRVFEVVKQILELTKED